MEVDLSLDGGRATAAWMVGAFLVVFLVTRVITRMIRAGRGPFRDTSVGGVHLHHLVYGIFLMLLGGAGSSPIDRRVCGRSCWPSPSGPVRR